MDVIAPKGFTRTFEFPSKRTENVVDFTHENTNAKIMYQAHHSQIGVQQLAM